VNIGCGTFLRSVVVTWALSGCSTIVLGVRADAEATTDSSSTPDVTPSIDAAVDAALPPVDALAERPEDARWPADFGRPPSCPPDTALIQAGTFEMGDADPSTPYAQPPHRVTLTRAFCLDLTEVTVAAFRACVGHGCTEPGTAEDCNSLTSRESHPINCVNWHQARAYCHFVGGELPTEAQWEFAARGTDGRRYPWGNEEPAAQLCSDRNGTPGRSTCPVASFPSTLHGLFDMEGNVQEWTLDGFTGYTADDVVDPLSPLMNLGYTRRGMGNWRISHPILVRAATRFGGEERSSSPLSGFRCVRPPV